MLGQEQRDLWQALGSGLRAACQRTPPRQGRALHEPAGTGCRRSALVHVSSPPLPPSYPPPDALLEVQGNTFREALELSGTPFPYFPEMMPQASGDQVMAPTPAEEKQLEEPLVVNWDQKCGGV